MYCVAVLLAGAATLPAPPESPSLDKTALLCDIMSPLSLQGFKNKKNEKQITLILLHHRSLQLQFFIREDQHKNKNKCRIWVLSFTRSY